MFLSNLLNVGPLIAAGVSLLLAAICYGKVYFRVTRQKYMADWHDHIGIAAVSGQAFASSR